jgi:hypothetical protein
MERFFFVLLPHTQQKPGAGPGQFDRRTQGALGLESLSGRQCAGGGVGFLRTPPLEDDTASHEGESGQEVGQESKEPERCRHNGGPGQDGGSSGEKGAA